MSLVTQMKGIIFLLYKPSRPSSSINPLIAYLYKPFKRYSTQEGGKEHDHLIDHERATSTAEEFKKVAEEKLKVGEQGVASQSVEKTYDAGVEAAIGESTVKSVKGRFQKGEDEADYHKSNGDSERVKTQGG